MEEKEEGITVSLPPYVAEEIFRRKMAANGAKGGKNRWKNSTPEERKAKGAQLQKGLRIKKMLDNIQQAA